MSARNACGVCTATSPTRSTVAVTRTSSTRFSVSVTARPGHRAVGTVAHRVDHRVEQRRRSPAGGRRRAPRRSRPSSGTAASPARTDSARVAPPVDERVDLGALPVGRVGHHEHDRVARLPTRWRPRGRPGARRRARRTAWGRRSARPTRRRRSPPTREHQASVRAATSWRRPSWPASSRAPGLSSLLSTASRRASAASSSTLSANVSSDTRIWRARASMRFSPADRPLSASRIERFRTTSATW